ncbi:MAG TPA: hypothetical protein VGC82_10865, partial [Rhodopila sp.]
QWGACWLAGQLWEKLHLEQFHGDRKRCRPVRRPTPMYHGRAWRGHPRLPLLPRENPVSSHRETALTWVDITPTDVDLAEQAHIPAQLSLPP